MKLLRLFFLILAAISITGSKELMAAPKTKKITDPVVLLAQAKQAIYDYDFDSAENLLDQFSSLSNKAKLPYEKEFDELNELFEIASNAFDRVQRIVVIDSINVRRESFFKAYRLANSAGKVGNASDFNLKGIKNQNEVSFLSESGDYFLTPIINEGQEFRIIENRQLLDGSWISQEIMEDGEKTGDYKFPFMSGDGQTLYFANNGEGSIGGYDLFVVQKQPITGETLQPLNLGMPFNSPYDDFMMAIDEENGVGWWATDRNSPGGDVTVYVYILDEVRKNYPTDTENLKNLAKITSFKDTWEEGKEKEYETILLKLPNP